MKKIIAISITLSLMFAFGMTNNHNNYLAKQNKKLVCENPPGVSIVAKQLYN
jgi:hypothetical protein